MRYTGTKRQVVICVNNEGYPASLERWKLYQAVPDRQADAHGLLRVIDEVTPAEKTLHLILDNYATHKHPKVQKWLARHPRFQIDFTPTSSSWLNMVERFFRDLTQNGLRRGVFRDVEELITQLSPAAPVDDVA